MTPAGPHRVTNAVPEGVQGLRVPVWGPLCLERPGGTSQRQRCGRIKGVSRLPVDKQEGWRGHRPGEVKAGGTCEKCGAREVVGKEQRGCECRQEQAG